MINIFYLINVLMFTYLFVFSQGEEWKSFRSTVNPVMLQPKTIKLYREEIDNVALDMIKRQE